MEEPLLPCRPLPSAYVPSLISRVFLVAIALLHGLAGLAVRWSVNYHTWLKFKSATLDEATFVKAIPRAHRGKAALVPLKRSTNQGTPYFFFQRSKYIYEPADGPGGVEPKIFRFVTSPDAEPVQHYVTWRGITGKKVVTAAITRHGQNVFEIPIPTFGELYKEQLLGPFTVFQFFCVMLWCLDEYWQYSVFTLGMLLIFEGTVVMSRLKSMQMLRSMGNAVRTLQVYRNDEWTTMTSDNLLPGDIFSLTHTPGTDGAIPCDCLLLRGSVVVNEATLTGESVPQMKEAIGRGETGNLDIKLQHKVHVLFGGTTLMQHSATGTGSAQAQEGPVPVDEREPLVTPDGGCLCYVLRIGFSSSQGTLVRMIEYSSEKVQGNTRESLLLVSMLCVFALVSSGYVLKKGLEAERDQFELLLHCILIVTSVIPPELNMQLALAVNTSLLALSRLAVFCTEPFRIPLAGKVDACLFDKTGTITTDKLVAVGVAAPLPGSGRADKLDKRTGVVQLIPMKEAPLDSQIVLGGCHSLVAVDGRVIGDPLEEAALWRVGWTYDAQREVASPNYEKPEEKKETASNLIPLTIGKDEKKKKPPTSNAPKGTSVRILHRHHFASKLQRMCVIARVQSGADPTAARDVWVLVKGSPEIVETLLSPHSPAPPWYHSTYTAMAKKGMRVIALATRRISNVDEKEVVSWAREDCERDLTFVGFVAFHCYVRKDSAVVLRELRESAHHVAMITGDGLLTAIYVAKEVGIVSQAVNQVLVLSDTPGSQKWLNYDDDSVVGPFVAADLPRMARDHDLCISGAALQMASESDPEVWRHMEHFRVFARMTPQLKERVLASLNDAGHFTLMCGDGANDVGALKQAHVGLALLSGFGNLNVAPGGEQVEKPETAVAKAPPPQLSREEMRKRALEQAEERKKLAAEKQAAFQKDYEERVRKGESFAGFKAMYSFATQEVGAAKKMAAERQAKGGFLQSAVAMAEANGMDGEMDMDTPMVKLGDASVASPFTSKMPSIIGALHIIKQGRCTLVATLQMYQILALNCLISSYSLSVLYLDGVKYGDTQMTAVGVLMSISFLAISRAKPLEKLTRYRPFLSIFHPALFISLMGQFIIHLSCMMFAVYSTKQHPDYIPDPNVEGQFQPNLINTVVFLVSSIQSVSVFAVNYKGLPFMHSMLQNKACLVSLALVGIGSFVCTLELVPEFNTYLKLVKLPDEAFQHLILAILATNVFGTFVWDRLMVAIFARDVFWASLKYDGPELTKELGQKVFRFAFTIFMIWYLLFRE